MSKIVHLTHPKSGSHWITDVLSDKRVLATAPGVRFTRCADYRLEYWAAQPDGFFTGPMFSVTFEEWSSVRKKGDKAVYVLRDPRDAVVSWTYSFAVSHESQPHIALIRPVLLANGMRQRLMVGIYQYWQSSWIVRSWGGRAKTESEYPTTFEAIVADEFGEFQRILDFLGWPVDDETLKAVVAQHTFERRTRGRKRGTASQFSHYRTGLPGEWKTHFDRNLASMFEAACPGMLVELGYETSNDWWKAQPEHLDVLAENEDDGGRENRDSSAVLLELERLRDERSALAAELKTCATQVEAVLRSLDSAKA